MKRLFTLLTAVLMLLSFLALPLGMRGQDRTTVTDTLTRASTGVTGTSYAPWSDVTSNSDAVYAGQSAGGNGSIQLRTTNNNSGIITTSSGGTVTSVSVTWNSNTASGRTLNIYGSNSAYSDPTELYNSSTQGTLLGTIVYGTSASLSIDGSYAYIGMRSASNAMYLEKIEITWSTGGTPTCATPTFSPVAGPYSETQNVTISTTTDGATIYYTTNGTAPTYDATGHTGTQYTGPITVSETTTLKAIAVKEGMNNSNVATATYTFPEVYTTIPALFEAATSSNKNVLVTFDNWVVSGVATTGKNIFVTDNDGHGLIIYYNTNMSSTFAAGDVLTGTAVACQLKLYNGSAELLNVNATDLTITEGGTVTTADIDMADLTGVNTGALVHYDNLTCSVSSDKYYLSDSTTTIQVYHSLYADAYTNLEANKVYNITAVYQQFNSTKEVLPRSADDIEEATVTPTEQVATPTFTPAEGTYTEAQTVTISCETAGATIYYTLDGTDPIDAEGPIGTEYTDSITISETTTVKAVAVRDGMTNSDIATAIYTINTTPTPVPQLTEYVLITDESALITGEKYIIVGVNDSIYKALGKQNDNNRSAVAVTPSNDTITVTPANLPGLDAVYELTLGQDNGNWTFYSAADSGYLYAASSSKNYLRTQAQNDANGQWTIEIAGDGKATITAQGNNSRKSLRYNSGNSLFACYAASSDMLQAYLYKAGDIPTPPAPTYYTISVADGIANGTVTVSDTVAEAGALITVTATPESGDYELESLTYTYAGVATPIDIMEAKQFNMPAADVTVDATFTEIPLDVVATPTFSPEAGSYITAQTVSIACDTVGATIYYTTDGTDPTPNSLVYGEPFEVSATTTVKAYAVKEGLTDSAIDSVTYIIIEPMTIAEAKALQDDQYALVKGVVTFIDGRNVYVQDTTSGIVLYLNNNTVPQSLAIGDEVMGYGKKTAYKGLIELGSINGGNTNQFIVLSNSNELPLAVATIEEILTDFQSGANLLQSTRVEIQEAIIGTINNSNNTPIAQGENTLNIYRLPVVEGLEENDIVTVIGIVSCYNNPQLRVSNADDVTFEHPAGLTVDTESLGGFTYAYGEGPSSVKTFTVTGRNFPGTTYINGCEYFEICSFPEGNFIAESSITINTYNGNFSFPIQVRLKADLEIGSYEDQVSICHEGIDTLYVTLTGTVTEHSQPSSDYVRISGIEQLTNGSKVIFAARYSETPSEYYAMPAQASGKPEGVSFTSVVGSDAETLPAAITDEEDSYYWTVETDGSTYTFTNAEGAVLGWNSSTNFATGGDNTAWTIESGTAEATAMAPNCTAFNIINVGTTTTSTTRGIALNNAHKFGPYAVSNMTSAEYNFFIDLFVSASGGTPTCAAPTFNPEGGVYFEAQTVTISCSTADAVIYYTLDGSDPTTESMVYEEPIEVAESVTIKAIAMKEGYNDSFIAEAEYTIILGSVTIFNQDWEGDMNGWTFVNVEGNKPWTIGNYSNNHYADANGYNDDVANEQWCISPAFNIDNYENVSLSFRNAVKYDGPDMEVYFSNDYDGEDPTEATWTELEYVKSEGNFVWAESGMISLEDLEGEVCYIGFRYLSNLEDGAAHWEVDDITLIGFTSAATLTVAPTSLTGFSYVEGNGPSAEQNILITGINITGDVIVSIEGDAFEMSDETGEDFDAMEEYEITPDEGALEEAIYVRMAEGLEAGSYTGTITVATDDEVITVTLEGTVIEPVGGGDWNRIGALSDLNDGDLVIIAARYDAEVTDGYYAMKSTIANKIDGVLFTSVTEDGVEKLPSDIADDANSYLWSVTIEDGVITLTNVEGASLGYGSGTNFASDNNAEWNISFGTAGDNAMVPNYSGFLINNVSSANRYIAENASNNYGAYAEGNINNGGYNFYLDLFVQGGTATQVVATPTFSVASGTYYDEFDVEIICATEGATIYYTTDGSDPTAASTVYEGAIHVSTDVTLKAIAMMEGYEDSGIATASYEVVLGLTVIFNQDWEGEMDGWTFVTVEGNKPWNINAYGGNHFAGANGYGDDVANEQWCISPAFDLTGYTRATLTFRNAVKFDGPALELLFSTNYDGEDPTMATWTPMDFIMSEGNYVWTESGEIILDEYRSENCYIAFRYISDPDDGAASWEVDDILLVATIDDAVSETTTLDVHFWNSGNEIFVENNTNGTLQMMVYDLLGQQVLAKTVNAGVVRFANNLANGLYVVTLQNSKGRMSVKMVVR